MATSIRRFSTIWDYKKHLQNLSTICLDHVYPRLCLYCEEPCPEGILCLTCFNMLEFTNVEDRCKRCFTFRDNDHEHSFCETCFKNHSPFYRILSPLETIGPAGALQGKLKRFTNGFLSKGLASLMMLYYLEQKLPKPDVIIPIPETPLKQFFNGKNATIQLAKIVSEILEAPVKSCLKAEGFFETLDFSLKKEALIENKIVLLVGENLNAPFFAAGNALIAGLPHSILGMAVFTSA